MRTSFTLLVITALVASVAFAQEDGEWAEVSDAGESSVGKKLRHILWWWPFRGG